MSAPTANSIRSTPWPGTRSEEPANLSLEGQPVELPVIVGSEGEKAIDISASGGFGTGLGSKAKVGVKGFAGIEIEFKGKDWTTYGYYGYSGGVSISLHLGIVSVSESYWLSSDKKRKKINFIKGIG